jgi:glyoxylase-like metal-dependent hydrolase (beta-lactamase superfamily II)
VQHELFGLPITWTSRWIFNCYAIATPADELVVVDPGLPSVANQMLGRIRDDLGREPNSIAAVLCTHGHSDHVGGVSTMLEHCSADVHLPVRCQAYLEGEMPRVFPLVESSVRFMGVYAEQRFSLTAFREFLVGSRKVGFGGRSDMQIDFDVAGFVADGDPMPSAPGWETIHAPGHTDDSTCFYHAETATLISGDAIVTEDGTAWFNPEYVDLETAGETIDRMMSLEVRHLLPGHGRPIEATNVWATARRPTGTPTGKGLSARCSRRFGRWPST